MDESIRARVADLTALGVELSDQGHLLEAEELFVGLRELAPDDVQVNSRLGVLLATRGAYAQAIPVLQDAVAANARDAVILNVLSVCAFETADYATALAHADTAIARRRAFPEAYNSRGNALTRLGRDAEALEAFRKALAFDEADAVGHLNIANALRNLHRPAEALASLDRALALDPSLAPAHANRGDVLQDLDRHAEAIAGYDQAAALDPQSVNAHWNRALCHLLMGDYAAGWREYEWRWRRPAEVCRPRGFATPLWLGQEPLAGRSILLHGEQGLGDCLQFARYVTRVVALGAIVTVEIYPTLVDLFRTIEGADVLPHGAALPVTDFQCPLMSLPLALGETAPPADTGPYLRAPEGHRAAWADRALAGGARRIGVVCNGSATNPLRSLPFALLSRFLPPGPGYHLLQKDIAPGDLEALEARPDVTVWRDDLASFGDTAALAERMDLMLSIDTSVVHVAAALGRPTWVLLPYDADWRWGLRTETSPWYPAAKLYRQATRGDWTGVLERLRADLFALGR